MLCESHASPPLNSDGGRHHPNTGFVLEAMRNSLGRMAFDRRSACVCTTTPGSSSRCGTRPKSFLRLSAKPTSCPSEVFYGCCWKGWMGTAGKRFVSQRCFPKPPHRYGNPDLVEVSTQALIRHIEIVVRIEADNAEILKFA